MSKAELKRDVDTIAKWLNDNPDHFTQKHNILFREAMHCMHVKSMRKEMIKYLHNIPWYILLGIINPPYDITRVRYNLTYGIPSVDKWYKEHLSMEAKKILNIPLDAHCVQMKVIGSISNSAKKLSHLWGKFINCNCTNATLDFSMSIVDFFKCFSEAGIHVDPIIQRNLVDIGYLNEQIRCQWRRRLEGIEAIRSVLPHVLADISIYYAYPKIKNLS